MIIITSKIFKKDRKYSKGSVGIITSKIFKGVGGNNYIRNYSQVI